MDRKTVFTIAPVYLSVILILALVFFLKRSAFFLPEAFGPVPLGVPWFGALGAVLLSLTGSLNTNTIGIPHIGHGTSSVP
jgi:hypothetical protein